MTIEWRTTFAFQIEILPRLTVIYGPLPGIRYGVGLEWLWFTLFLYKKTQHDD